MSSVENCDVSPLANTCLMANRIIVRDFLRFFAAGNVSDAIALFSTEATYWIPTKRTELAMPDFEKAVKWILSRLDGPIIFELGPMIAEENRVSVLVASFAKTVDGNSFNNLYNIYFEIDNGKITRAREYNDTAHVWSTLRATQ